MESRDVFRTLPKSSMGCFAEKVTGFYLLAIFGKHSILGVLQSSEYASRKKWKTGYSVTKLGSKLIPFWSPEIFSDFLIFLLYGFLRFQTVIYIMFERVMNLQTIM